MTRYGYDITDPLAIENFAKQLEGKCLADFMDTHSVDAENKGTFGNLVQTFLGIPVNSVPGADFTTIGGANVEVKSLPLRNTSKGLRVKERLVFNIIDYMSICTEQWDTSSFLAKNRLLLLFMYIHEPNKTVYEYQIHSVCLLDLKNIPREDLKIMQEDWEKIVSTVRNGEAENLSEGSTFYLGACTKGSTAEKSYRKQPYSDVLAKQRAFSWKTTYLNHVLEDICKSDKQGHSIFGAYSGKMTFEQLVISMFAPYVGMSAEDIAKTLNKDYAAETKHFLALMSKAILGAADTQDIQEFVNADVTMKTICLEATGHLTESISFPYIHYDEIIHEEWETSTLREMMDKKFFFVIFQKTASGQRVLRKAMFWNLPEEILESDVKKVWERTCEMIRAERFDELPGMSWNPVCHVRPHARNSEDTAITATGRAVVKKCFWLKNSFIRAQIGE